MRSHAVLTTVSIFIILSSIATFYQYRAGRLSGLHVTIDRPQSKNDVPSEPATTWTHIIWQSSKYAAEDHTEKERKMTKTWAELNPTYRHEVLTHERMLGYIHDNFQTSPELGALYDKTTDYMMRTDVLRYLVLLKDGGVYSDLDVSCFEPIDTWIPDEYRGKAGVVVGVENDYPNDDGTRHVSLVVWTMMAKPNQPFIRFVLDRLRDNMANLTPAQQANLTVDELLNVTGPSATWTSFEMYASLVTGTEVSWRNFTEMREPKMVGEVLVLPIWAFGARHQVRNAGLLEEQGRVLVKHWFKNSWKPDHGGKAGEVS